MPATEDEAVLICAAIAGGTAYQGDPDLELALTTTLPTATTAGSEVTGGNYARVVIDMAGWTADGVGGVYNAAAIAYPELAASDYNADVVAVEAYSTSDHTTRRWYIALDSPVTKVIGDIPQFPAGELYLTVV
jgi:hypothetical protein